MPHLLHRFISTVKARPAAHVALALVAAANQLTVTAFAAAPAAHSTAPSKTSVACAEAIYGAPAPCPTQSEGPQLSVPSGAVACPRSGPGASCSGDDTAAASTPGVGSVPPGQTACPNSATAPVPTTPAACSNALLAAPPPAPTSPSAASSSVLPSVPVASLQPLGSSQRLGLAVDTGTVRSGKNVLLTATASGVVNAGSAIEIFDQTSGTLAGACTQASQCQVAYAARGGVHSFSAYITSPTQQIPSRQTSVGSNSVSVGWLDSAISANNTVVGPGHSVTFTATSTLDVSRSGRWLQIYDLTAKTRLTYCSRGTVCTASVTEAAGGMHEVVAYVNGQPESVSAPIYVTWLTISLAASTTSPSSGGTIYLRASTNADITTTPWVIAIYDQHGRLVDHACKTGRSCSVQAWVVGATPWYTAEIGALAAPSKPTPLTRLLQDIAPSGLIDVQAHSSAVQPTRLLWGVDSCKSFTDNYWGTQGLLPKVVSAYGTPDFWGRYLTNTVCPGISANEVSVAARYHIGILPIYNDYNCSDVVGYSAGHSYAVTASQAAQSLGIPQGKVLAIDIEPAGPDCPGAANVDTGFIEGWYDGLNESGYVAAYYGNGTNGSQFAAAWCSTVAELPNVARDSYLWSFEPSLLGGYTKGSAPEYSPYSPGCAGMEAAWQYQLSAGSNPDVDSDLALSQLPIWYPQ
ncbi:MAG TPA: glycoside hydrolase domain-containing protein [Candidatus Dormibacteraeota bacterium]|nr:glycoside hydrolase domain-containing protein [Candidatus Dormibacteraeota bacterium]